MITSRIDPGGLFRCCIQTIRDDTHGDAIGRTMRCKWCDAPLVVVERHARPVWVWDRTALPTLKCIAESIRYVDPDDEGESA